MASKGSIWASIGLRTAEFKKSLLDLQVRSKSMGSSLKRGLSGLNPLALGAAAGFVAIGGAISGAVSVVNDFSKAQSEVEAVLGELGTNTAMARLSTQAKKLGSSTKFTATEVSNLQGEFAKLGFDPKQIEQMAESTLHAASALGSELGEQAALTGATLKSFNLDAAESGRVNDVLAKAASSSALDFSKLSTALPIVGATAKTAGVSLERTTALLGTLSDRGIDASSSATALRNIFLELSKKGLTFEEAMKKINTSTDKNATAMDLFGKRGATVGVILSETGGDVAALTKKLEEADGAAKDMAETMEDNLIGDMTKAKSAWEGFILSIEDGEGIISQAVRGATQQFTNLLAKITALNEGGAGALGQKIVAEGENMNKTIKGLGVSMAQLTAAAEQDRGIFNALQQGFKDGSVSAEKFKQGIESLAGGYTRLTAEEKHANRVAADRAELNLDKQFNEEEKAAFKAVASTKKFTKAQLESAEASRRAGQAVKFDLVPSKEEYGKAIQKGIDAIKSGSDTSMPTLAIPVTPKLEIDEGVEIKKDGKWGELGGKIGGVVSDGIEAGVIEGFAAVGEGLGTALADGDVSGIGQAFMTQVSGVIDGIGKQMIALGTAALLAKESLKTLFANPFAAIGAGVALVAVAAAMKSLLSDSATPFANGGIVSSPTMGLVGEYAGARHNPEVIAPLDKLQSMLGGTGGMQEIKVTGQLVGRGKDMVAIINEAVKVSKYSR